MPCLKPQYSTQVIAPVSLHQGKTPFGKSSWLLMFLSHGAWPWGRHSSPAGVGNIPQFGAPASKFRHRDQQGSWPGLGQWNRITKPFPLGPHLTKVVLLLKIKNKKDEISKSKRNNLITWSLKRLINLEPKALEIIFEEQWSFKIFHCHRVRIWKSRSEEIWNPPLNRPFSGWSLSDSVPFGLSMAQFKLFSEKPLKWVRKSAF